MIDRLLDELSAAHHQRQRALEQAAQLDADRALIDRALDEIVASLPLSGMWGHWTRGRIERLRADLHEQSSEERNAPNAENVDAAHARFG